MNTLLTGDLENSLYTYPIFPGKEKHYLKALIVRITYGSTMVPRGLYKSNDENPLEIEYEEEFKMPELTELNNLENWCFLHP